MSIGLGSIMKLAKGGIGPDELAEILGAVGIELSFTPRAVSTESFRPLADAASLPYSNLVEIKGRMKGGDSILGLLVMNQKSKQT
jgi:hypothetical protein